MIRKANVKVSWLREQARAFGSEAREDAPDLHRAALCGSICAALNELADRREDEEYGTCFDCTKRGSCERMVEMRCAGLKASYCANKEASRG